MAVLRQGSNRHCPPPPSLTVCPHPNCIVLIFVCPSIIAKVQLGQIKGVDGWILL